MQNNKKPTLEEVKAKCKEFAMLSKLNGSKINWDKCPGDIFQKALHYDREVVLRFYIEKSKECWDEAFGIKKWKTNLQEKKF